MPTAGLAGAGCAQECVHHGVGDKIERVTAALHVMITIGRRYNSDIPVTPSPGAKPCVLYIIIRCVARLVMMLGTRVCEFGAQVSETCVFGSE